MKSQSIFFVQSSHKTKTWWMFLSVLVLVFIPFLIVWLLCGEFNLLNNDWLIAKGASVWHGMVTSDNYGYLLQHYSKYVGGEDVLKQLLDQWMNKNASIDSSFTFFNPMILAPLGGLLTWSIVYPIFFNATKVSGIDIMPFSVGIGLFMFVLIISGLIDQWGQSLMPVYWICRILIAFVLMAAIFLLTNYLVNKYIASSNYATDFYFGHRTVDQQNSLAKEQLKENIDIFKKQKDSEESFVEVKDGD